MLAHAMKAVQMKTPLDALRTWAIKLCERSGFNKAAVGLANKMARIVWALEHRMDTGQPIQWQACASAKGVGGIKKTQKRQQ